jgi:hypothetical protein
MQYWTSEKKDEAILALAEELRAAVSFIEDKSRSERRRQACLRSFRETLAWLETREA